MLLCACVVLQACRRRCRASSSRHWLSSTAHSQCLTLGCWHRTASHSVAQCTHPHCSRFAELEVMLAEGGRARALFELAISQPVLDMPEALWKAYIDYEISQARIAFVPLFARD